MFLRLESRQSRPRLNTSPAWSSYSWPMTKTPLQPLGPMMFWSLLNIQCLSDWFRFVKSDVAVDASDHRYLQVDITTTSTLYTRSVLNLLCNSTIESFELAELSSLVDINPHLQRARGAWPFLLAKCLRPWQSFFIPRLVSVETRPPNCMMLLAVNLSRFTC